MDRQTDPDSRSHGLFDQINFARAGVSRRIFHRPFLNFGNSGRNSNNHAGCDQFAVVDLLNEVPQHRLGDFEIGDNAVFHRPDGDDVARGASQHALGFFANRQNVAGDIYQGEMGDWIAHRRDVDWAEAHDAPIAPLLDQLDFTAGKTNWGYQLRFGLFEISAHDFELVGRAMGVDL